MGQEQKLGDGVDFCVNRYILISKIIWAFLVIQKEVIIFAGSCLFYIYNGSGFPIVIGTLQVLVSFQKKRDETVGFPLLSLKWVIVT
jgi:hypothetical protein